MSDNRTIKGKRPDFYPTPGVDYLMHMVMVLAQELSATRDRLDTFERIIEQKNLVQAQELENYVADQDVLEQREARRQDFLSNLFSVMSQEAAELQANDTRERFDKVIDELAR